LTRCERDSVRIHAKLLGPLGVLSLPPRAEGRSPASDSSRGLTAAPLARGMTALSVSISVASCLLCLSPPCPGGGCSSAELLLRTSPSSLSLSLSGLLPGYGSPLTLSRRSLSKREKEPVLPGSYYSGPPYPRALSCVDDMRQRRRERRGLLLIHQQKM